MFRGIEAILIGSPKAKKLADFYKLKVGLKCTLEAQMGEKGESDLFGFEFGKGKTGLYVMDHSKVKGQSKDPSRVIFNLEVDNIEKEVARLKSEKVKVVQDIYHVENYGHVATFEDLDGNYFQLVQVRAE